MEWVLRESNPDRSVKSRLLCLRAKDPWGLGGSCTLISRGKSPVSFLFDDEPSCYLFLATLSFMIIPSLLQDTPPSFIAVH